LPHVAFTPVVPGFGPVLGGGGGPGGAGGVVDDEDEGEGGALDVEGGAVLEPVGGWPGSGPAAGVADAEPPLGEPRLFSLPVPHPANAKVAMETTASAPIFDSIRSRPMVDLPRERASRQAGPIAVAWPMH
jgi:hypothetical protein